MTPIVTVDEVRARLRIDADNQNDADLEMLIEGATDLVLTHIKDANRFVQEVDENDVPVVGENGLPVYTDEVLPRIKLSIMLMVGYLNKDRDNDSEREYDGGNLPRPVVAFLRDLRDPTLA